MGIMERITPSEQVRLKIAPYIDHVIKNANNILEEYKN